MLPFFGLKDLCYQIECGFSMFWCKILRSLLDSLNIGAQNLELGENFGSGRSIY